VDPDEPVVGGSHGGGTWEREERISVAWRAYPVGFALLSFPQPENEASVLLRAAAGGRSQPL
ncbi:hypothetical protein TIFTF001_048172, partial [Ficus carica]